MNLNTTFNNHSNIPVHQIKSNQTSSSSQSLSQNKRVIDPKRIPLNKHPKWYQNEKITRIAGVALLTLGVIGAGASIASIIAGSFGIAFGGKVLIISGAIGLAASISAIATGIALIKKDCWNDQMFVDRVAEKVQGMPFDEIINKYGWERTCQNTFISKDRLTQKFLEKVQSQGLDYLTVRQSFGDKIHRHQFIRWTSLHPLLMGEIESQHMDIFSFKQKYGNQPLNDGVFSKNDPWYLTETLKGIEGKSYESIKHQFQAEIKEHVITRENISDEMRRQYAKEPSFESFMKKQTNFWSLLSDNILPPDLFTKDVMEQTKEMKISEILKTFSWQIFNRGILSGEDFQSRFLTEVKELAFMEVINKYGWEIFSYSLAEPKHFHEKVIKEITSQAMSFAQILSAYSMNIFSKEIISGNDPIVGQAFVEHAKQHPFCNLWETFGRSIINYKLLSERILIKVEDLGKMKDREDKIFSQKLKTIENNYETMVETLKKLKHSKIETYENTVRSIQDVIDAENNSYRSQKSSLEFTLSIQESRMHRSHHDEVIIDPHGRVIPGQSRRAHDHAHYDFDRTRADLDHLIRNHHHKINDLENQLSGARSTLESYRPIFENEYRKDVRKALNNKNEFERSAQEMYAMSLNTINEQFKAALNH